MLTELSTENGDNKNVRLGRESRLCRHRLALVRLGERALPCDCLGDLTATPFTSDHLGQLLDDWRRIYIIRELFRLMTMGPAPSAVHVSMRRWSVGCLVTHCSFLTGMMPRLANWISSVPTTEARCWPLRSTAASMLTLKCYAATESLAARRRSDVAAGHHPIRTISVYAAKRPPARGNCGGACSARQMQRWITRSSNA